MKGHIAEERTYILYMMRQTRVKLVTCLTQLESAGSQNDQITKSIHIKDYNTCAAYQAPELEKQVTISMPIKLAN
jgi:hypothetical protein